jgi:hypothetical protein
MAGYQRAMFPNCLCDNSVRDATYEEVYSVISNTVHINGFRCRRACSVPSLMFHRVNRTSRYPRGWFGVVGQAPLPRRGIREGDPFCGPVDLYPCCRSTVVRVEGRVIIRRSHAPNVSGECAPANRVAAAIG